jgi:hypothetical protein
MSVGFKGIDPLELPSPNNEKESPERISEFNLVENKL